MSQRQDKYIAQLLKANRDLVLEHYRAQRAEVYAYGRFDYDIDHAQRALRNARDRVLLDIAVERNVVQVEWENDELEYEYGDISERERAQLEAKLESGVATVETMLVNARDRKGEWEVVDSLGSVWVESQDDRDQAERNYIDSDAVRNALYCNRAAVDLQPPKRRYVPGHWVTE